MMDNVIINIRKRSWRSWCYWSLYRLTEIVCIKSQLILDQNSLITELLTTRPKFILKRIKEDWIELTFAVNFQVDYRVVMKSIDLTLQVFLLARSIGLNIDNIIRQITYNNIEALTQRYRKRPTMLRINRFNYNRDYRLSMNSFRNNELDNIILSRLNNSILNLSIFITKLGTNDYRYQKVIDMLFSNILQNIVTLIYNSNIKYSEIINDVINKID